VDPVVVGEFDSQAEISGYHGITRRSTAHGLSVRMAMKQTARDIGRPVGQINLVVAHLGGGITIATVRRGRIVDTNIALLGEGPFTPCRAGQLPLGELIDICYSGRFTRDELIRELTGNGGLRSYLGEHRMEVIEKRIADGDQLAERVVAAMVYQMGKGIGAAYVAAGCDVEAIVLTGGLMRSELIRNSLRKRVGRLAPILVYRESLDMKALATGAVDALSGRVKIKRYSLPRDKGLCGGLQDG
jgi:butyrate kinase